MHHGIENCIVDKKFKTMSHNLLTFPNFYSMLYCTEKLTFYVPCSKTFCNFHSAMKKSVFIEAVEVLINSRLAFHSSKPTQQSQKTVLSHENGIKEHYMFY